MFAIKILIFTILISITHQIQNLCGDNPAVLRVPDPSNCHLYITCDRSISSVIPRVGSCYSSHNFVISWLNRTNVECTNSSSHCIDPLWLCPPANEHDIMIADPYDRTCRRHRQCRNLSGNFNQCSESLVFNRNTGLCDLPSNAPCERVLLPAKCPVGFYGFYPGTTCYEYIYCSNGDILLTLECSIGMIYDEHTGNCVNDYNNECPRS